MTEQHDQPGARLESDLAHPDGAPVEVDPDGEQGPELELGGPEQVGGELDESGPLLAEEEAAEAPFHEGEPAQPADYAQEDVDETPEEAASG